MKMFAYKGYIGIDGWADPMPTSSDTTITKADLSAALINDPTQPGQLGFIVDASKCKIQKEAVQLLKNIKKSNDAIGDVMCWQAGTMICFGWMGGVNVLIDPDIAEADRDYDPTLLENLATEFDTPQSFIDFVDSLEHSEQFEE